jgi:(E)-4-hydroxy-3-methylbut-2-enyl-diphosphate synthase
LAADPVEEVKVGFEILKSLELRHRGVNVIACPTCGRVEIDVVKMANELEHRLGHINNPITVSVLGCVVNGIGEGKEADIGIAGGQGVGIVFKKGKLYKRVPSEELMDTLIEEVEAMAKEQNSDGQQGIGSQPSPLLSPLEELSLSSPKSSSREIPVLPLK